MKNGFKVMDSDIHVMEPADLYSKYMDPKWGDAVPRPQGPRPSTGIYTWVKADGSRVRTLPAELEGLRDPVRGAGDRMADPRFAEALERDYDARSMLDAMDVEGVDVSVLFRTQPQFADETQDPEYSFAIARAWNDWVTAYASANPERLRPAGQVPLNDIDLAVKEARRVITELGHIGLCVHPEPIHGHVIHDPYFDPLWATAQEMDVPICFHPTAGANQPNIGSRFLKVEPRFLWGALTQPIEDLLALASFCGGGVLEKFPRLRVAFLEGNCAWLPWLLYRLDERCEHARDSNYAGVGSSLRLTMLPSEYFKRQGFVSVDPDEYLAADVIKHVGDDNLVFSTDWPHGDARYPEATDTLLSMPGISDESKRKIFWDNTARLYNLVNGS